MLLSSSAIIITKQLTLSVTWPLDSSPALYYKWSCAYLDHYGDMVLQRWWGHDLDLLGPRDVIGHVTIRLVMATSYEWSIVTMRLSYMEIWRLKCWTNARTHTRTDKCSGDFYYVQCYALHWTDKSYIQMHTNAPLRQHDTIFSGVKCEYQAPNNKMPTVLHQPI